MFNAIRRASSRRVRPRTSLILGPVADVRGRGATGFQVRIALPAKSHLRDHFLVAWIMFQLARAESREGAVPIDLVRLSRTSIADEMHEAYTRRTLG
jgi:hypothetical protein